MCKVAKGNFVLFVDVGEERTLVVDMEGEDTMLIRQSERGAVDCAVVGARRGCECKAVVRGKHGEFELNGVGRLNLKWGIVVVRVLGQLNAEGLINSVQIRKAVDNEYRGILWVFNIPHRS